MNLLDEMLGRFRWYRRRRRGHWERWMVGLFHDEGYRWFRRAEGCFHLDFQKRRPPYCLSEPATCEDW